MALVMLTMDIIDAPYHRGLSVMAPFAVTVSKIDALNHLDI